MITETATVVAVNGDRVTVSASVKTACGSCQAADDCGTSAVAKAFSPKQQTFDLVSPLPLKAGDLVTLGIPEAHLLSASWMMYVVPLLVLIGSALILTELTELHELQVFLASGGFTWLAFQWVSNRLQRRRNGRYEPVIVSKINHVSTQAEQ